MFVWYHIMIIFKSIKFYNNSNFLLTLTPRGFGPQHPRP
jgi:hypothetical protein